MVETILHDVVRDHEELWSPGDDEYAMSHLYVMSVLACMHAAGWHEMDYGTLVVESGVGLSFAYKRADCAPMYALNFRAGPRIADAIGFRLETTKCETPEDAWSYVRERIDRGVPSICEYAEPHVVSGYREGTAPSDRAWLVLGNAPISEPVAWLAWDQIVDLHDRLRHSQYRFAYAGKVEPRTESGTAQQVVRWLVEWSEVENHPGRSLGEPFASAHYGLEAIEAYARDLADTSCTVENTFEPGYNGCHAITPQWTSRRHIAAYLRANVARFPEATRSHLRAAADGYAAAHAAWVPYDEQLGQRLVRRDGGDAMAAWVSAANRRAGSTAVAEALAHETSAVAALREALAAIGDA